MKTPGKHTQIIVSFLLLALIWNLECREMAGPSTNVLKKIEKCDSTEGPATKVEKYRINKYNRTAFTYDINIELQTELTDEDSEININVEKWGNGGWRHIFVKILKNACSSFEQIAPNFIQSIVKPSNNITGCPIPAGNYELKDLVINLDVAITFPYGLYRCRMNAIKNSTLIFCIRFILEVLPLG
uniref:Protein g.405 clastoptera arizonana n=1 Tax=Rhodnius prolixus TaxID=13249 RepID=A0A4P6D990_RHOPR